MRISKERIKQIIKEELSSAHHETSRTDQEDETARIRRHLDKISTLASHMVHLFEEEREGVPEWIQEKVAVAAAMLQTISDYQENNENEKVR